MEFLHVVYARNAIYCHIEIIFNYNIAKQGMMVLLSARFKDY